MKLDSVMGTVDMGGGVLALVMFDRLRIRAFGREGRDDREVGMDGDGVFEVLTDRGVRMASCLEAVRRAEAGA